MQILMQKPSGKFTKFILGLSYFMLFSLGHVFAQDVSEQAASQDILLKDPVLSLKYQKGEYLIYDCADKHWVCTAKPEFKQCIEDRNKALAEKNNLPCAPFRKFSSDTACLKHQRRMVNKAMQGRYCLRSDEKEIEKVY